MRQPHHPSDCDQSVPIVRENRVRRILEMIEMAAPQTIADVASELKLSESHLQHLFKQETGVGLGHALTEKRLQKAARLLALTSMRVKEIAAAVGYEHTSSFTRAFVQRFAQTPRRYRTVAKSP